MKDDYGTLQRKEMTMTGSLREEKRPLRVLLIEDNAGDADSIRGYVRDNPISPVAVQVAATFADGIGFLRVEMFDLILLDLNLSDSIGAETFEKLHNIAPKIPVMVINDNADMIVAEECIEKGAQDYLAKEWLNQSLALRIWNVVLRTRVEADLATTRSVVSLVEENPDGVLVLSQHGVIRFANTTAQTLFEGRITVGDSFGFPVVGTGPAELMITRKDGSTAVVAMRVGEIEWDGDGSTIVTLRDETEQRLAQEALRKSEMRYRQVVDNVHDIIYSGNVGDEFVTSPFLLMSPQTESILGIPHEAFLGNPNTWRESIHPEDAARVLEETRQALKTGVQCKRVYRMKNELTGEYCWLEDDFHPQLDDKGKTTGFFGVARDISARKRAEQERERLLLAVEQSTEGLIITDPEGTIYYANSAVENILDSTPEEIVGKNLSLLITNWQEISIWQDIWDTVSSGRTWQGQVENLRSNGSTCIVDAVISPVFEMNRTVNQCLIALKDITEEVTLKRENAELEARNRQIQRLEAVGQLAGGVAHDFNNMLTVIIGYADSILEKLHQSDPLRDSVGQILNAGRRSADLTRQLLAFSRRQTLQPEVVDINDIVINLEKMLRRLIGENIDLETVLAEELRFVKVDPGQIEQVIMNLAVNARDAMPEGGRLIIETTNAELDEHYAQEHVGVSPGKYVMLAITDTGCGMGAETREKIFEPFFTTKEKGKGTGLGLATVYGIIKQSGGNIWVYSEPGQGTTFKVYLPEVTEIPTPKDERTDTKEIGGGEETILVVEDEPALRKLCAERLTSLNYDVTVAANGEEALLQVEENGLRPDLLITDVVMPGIGGPLLAERIRGIQPDLKVLYMSGYTDNSIVHHGVLDEGTPFLQKPFTARDLSEKIRSLLHENSDPARGKGYTESSRNNE